MSINWITLYKKYKGQWVALKSDEKTVISSAKNAITAHEKALKKGFSRPYMTFIPTNIHPMVGFDTV